MSGEDDLGFQIIDKRQFGKDGEPLDRTKSEFKSELESKSEPEFKSESGKKNAFTSSTADVDAKSSQVEGRQTGVDFSSFIVGMMHQAVIMLGESPHPETGQIVENLEAARQTIEILALLEQKTKGNLIEEEEQLLRDGVTGLRMAYVAKVKDKKSK